MARSPVSIIPQHGERAWIVGQTGGGKTALGLWLLVRIPTTPTFIYDTKVEPKFDKLPNNRSVVTIDDMREAYQDHTVDYIIVRPPVELLGEPSKLDEYLWTQYLEFPDTVAYLDEGATFHSRTGMPYKGIMALMMRGRSKGITTIISTQRPTRIAREILSEMQKAYIFYLQDRRNREVIDNVVPDFSDMPNPGKHEFYFWNQENNAVELFKPIRLDPAFDTGYTDVAKVGTNETHDVNHDIPANPTTKHVWV